MPAKILCLHRDDALGALYELFKLCRSDWSAPASAKSQDVSGGSDEDGDDNTSEILFVESDIGIGVGSFEGFVISQGDKVAIATTNLPTQVSDPGDEYARQTNISVYAHADSDSNQQRPCTDVVLHNRRHVIARRRNQISPTETRKVRLGPVRLPTHECGIQRSRGHKLGSVPALSRNHKTVRHAG